MRLESTEDIIIEQEFLADHTYELITSADYDIRNPMGYIYNSPFSQIIVFDWGPGNKYPRRYPRKEPYSLNQDKIKERNIYTRIFSHVAQAWADNYKEPPQH